jgi:rRNA-processing protein FCF1
VPRKSRVAAICDANVLIDYVAADEDVIRELVKYWGTVYVPDRILHEVNSLPDERAGELGLTIIETPLALPIASGLSGPDRACLHFVIAEGWTCIANDKRLRRECKRKGGKVVWSLEMLQKLVAAEQITVARAKGIAKKIGAFNPEITEVLLGRFEEKLASPKIDKSD